ncbi:MAG: hypothetical protein OSA97_09180, partial [Nevskia sp.]|nr:hypothetical protein [Nevskia sp.]
MLHHAFVEIRWLTANGQSEQASDLADAFHNLPGEMWRTFFSFSYFRAAFLEPYYRKWPQVMAVDYRMLLSEAEGLA